MLLIQEHLVCLLTVCNDVFRMAVLSPTCRRQTCFLFMSSTSSSSFHVILLSQLQVSATAVTNCYRRLFTDLSYW